MANTYCTATNTGKGFFTGEDRNDFYLSGHPGNVWVVGNNPAGIGWINRINGTGKLKAEAQAIVDGEIEAAQAVFDGLTPAEQEERSRPEKYTLPQELTMADYKALKGFNVESLAADPSVKTSGQVWYNTTGAVLKYSANAAAAAWSSATATPTALMGGAAAGTSTAALVWGGTPGPVATTFEYDGTTWTAGGTYPISQNRASGFGTQTAALGAGGNVPPQSDVANTYNGSTWTTSPALNTARSAAPAFGTQTAAILAGGWTAPTRVSTVEEFNGTSWTAVTSMPAVKADGGGGGTSTAGLGFLGTDAPGAGGRVATSYSYNGSSWTTTNACNTARSGVGSGGTTETTTMTYGGEPPAYIADTEQFNGTSWTEVANLATARQAIFNPLSQGTQENQLCIMGDTGTAVTSVEEWQGSPRPTKTVTVT